MSISGVLAKKTIFFVAKSAPYGVVLCRWGRGEPDNCNVLDRRACDTDEGCYGCSKFATNLICDFSMKIENL